MRHKFRVLSIDGGGLKGLIAIKVLQIIESITGARVAEQFDLLAGTSTGGLIAAALATSPEPGGTAYNLEHIESLYLEVGQEIFHQGGLSYGEAAVKKFDRLLSQTFGGQRLSQSIKPLLIPTYDIDRKKLVVFKTRSAGNDISKDPRLTEVCRATTAIAPVFPPYEMNHHGRTLRCVDAGYHLKNPALSAFAEVWKHRAHYATEALREEDIVLLSVSTGSFHTNKADWTTDIGAVLHSQKMDMKYLESQKLDIGFAKVRFLRIDLNLGGSAFSIMQLLEWLERIEGLRSNKGFRDTVYGLLAERVDG